MRPTYFIPEAQDDDFIFPLEEEEEEEEVCSEEEEKEFKEALRRSMDRPLLSPPDYGYPDEEGVPRPNFILIEQKAYFIDRDNVTTASCDTREPDLKGRIKVTFCTAPPPLVSYYCVHATAYAHTDFITDPLIIASETDGGIVLLCLIIGQTRSDFFRPSCRHWFVYDAGTPRRRPSLKHLPHPGAVLEFNGPSFAIVRDCSRKKEGGQRANPARSQDNNSEYCGPTLRPRHKLRPPPRSVGSSADHSGLSLHPHSANPNSGDFALYPNATSEHQQHDCSSHCEYVIVVRSSNFGYESPSLLWMYHSKTDNWSVKPVQPPVAYHGHITCKTTTIGEVVAWADLSRDIIFCDVLAEIPKFRVVSLPLPIEKLLDPRTVRDIAIVDGRINYLELNHKINNDTDTIVGWSAAKWSMEISSPTEAWRLDHKVDSSTISGSSKVEGNAHTAQPNLQSLCLGLPNLSLDDKDVVYCLAKIHYMDSEKPAWVIAIDCSNNAIHEAVQFNAMKTVGVSLGYSASKISKYLRPTPGTKQKKKRQGSSLLGCPNKKYPGVSLASHHVSPSAVSKKSRRGEYGS